jgi:hypothetical protein
MNKFVFSALAASVASATGFASETEWPELDRELEALSTTIQTQTTSPFMLSGWVGAAWDASGDITFPDASGGESDLGGFDIRTARLRAEGDVRNYGYRLEVDFGSNADGTGGTNGVLNTGLYGFPSDDPADGGTDLASLQDPSYDAKLLDAWGAVTVHESFKVTMGRFRQPFTQSGLVDRNRTLFIDRTVLGDRYAVRDEGAMLSGKFSMVGWYLSAQNGMDDRANEYLLTGRVTVDILGEGAGYNAMTAYGAPEGTNVTVAAAFSDEGAVQNGTQVGGEVYLTSGPFFLGGEIVSLDDGLVGDGTTGSATPWDINAAYLIANAYEIALGWQEFDRSLSTADPTDSDRAYTAAVNWYHDDWDTKWTLQWQRVDSRDDVNDADIISVGLTVSF